MQEFNGISDNSKTPKYIQLVNLIINHIKDGKLNVGDRLPSINEISSDYYLSRDTVEKALNELRKRGIITSVKRRGYFISKTDFDHKKRIAFITNKISDYKRNIYEAFMSEMEDNALVDVYVYNYDISKFEMIILSHLKEYDHYLVVPYFLSEQYYSKATDLLNRFMDHQLIILDNFIKGIKPAYSSVTQNFELDIREALTSMNDHLSKYKKHFLIYKKDSAHPVEVIKGFGIYCKMHDYECDIVHSLEPDIVQDQNNYVLLDDEDLVELIEFTRQKKLELGKQIGLISYNETHLKRILAGGITVISTDWDAIGKTAAELILQKKTDHIRIPYKVYLRNSIIKNMV